MFNFKSSSPAILHKRQLADNGGIVSGRRSALLIQRQ